MKRLLLLALAGLFATALGIEAVGVNGVAGLDEWPDEYQITSTADSSFTSYPNGHKIALSSAGVGHVVWVTHDANYVFSLHYKRYYPATGWTADTVLVSMGERSNSVTPHASIALDANGTDIHVVWTGRKHLKQCYYHTFYLKCVPGTSGNGGWVGTPTDLCTNHTEYAHCDPAVACASGRVAVTWYEVDEHGSAIGFREFASNRWQNPVVLEATSTYRRALASVTVAANGNTCVAYYGTQAGQSNFHVYVFRRVGGAWQAREDATAAFPTLQFVLADIDFNPVTSNPHVVVHGFGTDNVFRIYHTYRTVSGWQTPEVIPGAGSGPDCDDVQPSMFFGSDGKAHVVWYEYNVDPTIQRGIEYSVCASEGGTWSTSWLTAALTSYVQLPNVTVSSAGAGFAVWTKTRDPGAFQVWGRTLPAGGFSGIAAEPTTPVAVRFELFPNPSLSGRVTVRYALPTSGPLTVALLDVTGRAVRTQQVQAAREGAVSIDASGLSAGVYLVRIAGAGATLSDKLVIQR